MAKKRSDPLAGAIERALTPGRFIDYRENWDFIVALRPLREKIAALIEGQEAPRAIVLLEAFIAGCYEKAEEIDDSDGDFGMFVEELFSDWIRARQAVKADPEETARMLLSWMENDDYGYCNDLEKQAVKVLDRLGLRAFEQAIRERLDDSAKESYDHRWKVEILKAIHEKRRDLDAYTALCEAEGELGPGACEVLARMCLGRRRPEQALGWVERGLELMKESDRPGVAAWQLPDLQREILIKLGRRGDAQASAWEDYRRAPSVVAYEILMKFVPRGERAEWHAKAMAALDGADLSSRIELLVMTNEAERLAKAIDAESRGSLVALSHFTTEPAAERLEKSHPLLAAKLHVAMALRILEAKKSKYYDAALRNLGKARTLLIREGRPEEWAELAGEIRAAHRRKFGFMPGFERLGAERAIRGPSFLDRARKRWIVQLGRKPGKE